ncbi:MAG: hypothetical protein QXU20_00610 [Candidatus Woesearchaeota archaeon]
MKKLHNSALNFLLSLGSLKTIAFYTGILALKNNKLRKKIISILL